MVMAQSQYCSCWQGFLYSLDCSFLHFGFMKNRRDFILRVCVVPGSDLWAAQLLKSRSSCFMRCCPQSTFRMLSGCHHWTRRPVRANLPLVYRAPHYPFTWPSFSLLCVMHTPPRAHSPSFPSFSSFVLCNHQLCVWQQTQTNPQAPAQLSVARGTRVFPPPPIPPTPPTHCDLQPNPPAITHQTFRPVAAIHSLTIETLQWSSVAEFNQTSGLGNLDPEPDSL